MSAEGTIDALVRIIGDENRDLTVRYSYADIPQCDLEMSDCFQADQTEHLPTFLAVSFEHGLDTVHNRVCGHCLERLSTDRAIIEGYILVSLWLFFKEGIKDVSLRVDIPQYDREFYGNIDCQETRATSVEKADTGDCIYVDLDDCANEGDMYAIDISDLKGLPMLSATVCGRCIEHRMNCEDTPIDMYSRGLLFLTFPLVFRYCAMQDVLGDNPYSHPVSDAELN